MISLKFPIKHCEDANLINLSLEYSLLDILFYLGQQYVFICFYIFSSFNYFIVMHLHLHLANFTIFMTIELIQAIG